MGDEMIYIVILLVYLAGMLVIGFISSKKVTNSKSYYTSDRNVSAAVTGFSYSSTQLSSGSTIGMPATVYTQGYSYMGTPMAAAAAPWFTFLLTGERVRKISERVDAIDYGDIFRARFGNASKILYELLIIVFAIPTIISQFAAAGSSVQSLTGISYNVAIPMIAVVLTIYTMSGGMNSVALTDYIQGIIMIAGFGILAAILLTRAGGFTAMHEGIAATDPDLLRLTGKASKTWVICCIITWSILMVGGSITSVVRFLIPKDLKALRGALGYSVFFSIFVLSACGVIGLCGITLLPGLESTDRLVPTLIGTYMTPILGGILISAVIAAIMSSVDSTLLLCSAAAEGLYIGYINPNASAKQQLRVGRAITVVVAAVAMVMAFKPFTAIQWLVAFSFNTWAGAFTVPVLFALWSPGTTKTAGFCAMAAGAAAALAWYAAGYIMYNSFSNWPFGIWPGIFGSIVSLIVILAVSAFTKPIDEETREIFYLE